MFREVISFTFLGIFFSNSVADRNKVALFLIYYSSQFIFNKGGHLLKGQVHKVHRHARVETYEVSPSSKDQDCP